MSQISIAMLQVDIRISLKINSNYTITVSLV